MCYERRRAEDGTREEPGTLIQGAPVFPGSSRLGIKPKTPGCWLVQDPTTSPSGDLIPTIRGSGAHPGRGKSRYFNTGLGEVLFIGFAVPITKNNEDMYALRVGP
jgi:hypothetical protein